MRTKKQIMGTIMLGAFAAAVSMGLSSCGNKTEDTKDVAQEHNDAKFDDKKAKDAEFLVNAAGINMEEIQLGELAQQQAVSQDVKDLGKMMVDEHQKVQAEVQALATSKSITLPTSLTKDGQDAYDKLMKQTGTDFDKKYANMMVDGHKDAISMFEKESNDAEDADIRNFASKTLPQLRAHLDHSMSCADKYK